MKQRVLCVAASSDNGPHLALLNQAGFECDIVDQSLNVWDGPVLVSAVQGYHAVVAGSEPWPAGVIAECRDLRVIARTGVGFDAIDTAACDAHGIAVTTTPGVNHHAVAEHAIAMLVALARGFPRRDQQVRQGIWERRATARIQGRTLGLIGFGRIGQAMATRGHGLGIRVIASDPAVAASTDEHPDVSFVDLEELLRQSDFVSLHAPDLPETRQLINDESIGLMRRGSFLINTARGALVDESALIRGLESQHLGGAGLDVFETEPLPADSPLISMDNVILSGHVAGLDHESHHDTYQMVAETIIGLRDGAWPADCIQNLRGVSDWQWESAG